MNEYCTIAFKFFCDGDLDVSEPKFIALQNAIKIAIANDPALNGVDIVNGHKEDIVKYIEGPFED